MPNQSKNQATGELPHSPRIDTKKVRADHHAWLERKGLLHEVRRRKFVLGRRREA